MKAATAKTATTRIDKQVKEMIRAFRKESGLNISETQIVSEGVSLWLRDRGAVYIEAKRQMEKK